MDGYKLSDEIERVYLASTCSDAEVIATIARARNVPEERIVRVDDIPPQRFIYEGDSVVDIELVEWEPEKCH